MGGKSTCSRDARASRGPPRGAQANLSPPKSIQPAGGLRQTLVEAAAALISKKGPQGFSLREVARRAHVPEAAPYWHFADREALLRGGGRAGLRGDGPGHDDDPRRHHRPARAPALARYRLRAVRPRASLASTRDVRIGGSRQAAHPALKEAGTRTFDLLVQAIADCQAAGQTDGDPVVLAVAASSIVHGLSALLVDGRLKERAVPRGGGAAGRAGDRGAPDRPRPALTSRRPRDERDRRGSLLSRVLRSICARTIRPARGLRRNRNDTREGKTIGNISNQRHGPHGGRRRRHAAPLGAARRAWPDRDQVRMRRRAVRRLHRPRRRPRDALMRDARGRGLSGREVVTIEGRVG